MAQFDLKNATIRIKDGYSLLGAINHLSGYNIGATTIAVDGLAITLAAGDKFKIAGDTGTYTVVSSVGGATPTSITFTPGLATAVLDNAVISVYQPNVTDNVGAVNNVAGYAAGALNMDMDGLTVAITANDIFLITGQTTVYTVVSSTGGSTPTNVVFTPALTASVADDAVLTFYELNADTGAINYATSGFTAGDTIIATDGFTGAVAVGDYFTLAGDASATEYRVTAHTESGGNTVSITFTPAIPVGSAVADNAVVTVGPHRLEVKLGDGNLTYSEKRPVIYVKDRGRLSTAKLGDEEPVDVKLDAMWEYIRASSGSGTPTIEDAMKQRGEASSWVSSSDDPCEPYAVDIEIEYEAPCGDEEVELIVLPDFRYEEIPHDTKAGTLSFSGKCNVIEAVVSRVAA